MNNNDNLMDNLKSDLYEIYLNLKDSLSMDKIDNETDKDISISTDIHKLVKYIKNNINDILQEKNLKNENNNNISEKEIIRQLESYIRKLESDIKYHLKMHYQNQIYRDSLIIKIKAYMQIEEDYENLREKVRYDEGKFLENDRKDNEIIILRRENSNIKKEINKIKDKYRNMEQLEEKYKQLQKIHIKDEENIKNLNLKIEQLKEKIAKLEEEMNTTKNTYSQKTLKYRNGIIIRDNIFNANNNFFTAKISLDKNNTKSTSNNSKKGENNHRQYMYIFNNESKQFKNRTMKILDTYNSLLNSDSYNNNIISQIKSNVYKSVKKRKSNSISLRAKSKETSELLNKCSSNKDISNYAGYTKSIFMRRFNQNMTNYKFHLSNNSVKSKHSKEKKSNKNNIIYEHSALNILNIHGKYKI